MKMSQLANTILPNIKHGLLRWLEAETSLTFAADDAPDICF